MAKLTKILRSGNPVSETEANTVFDLLIPVIEKETDATDAADAAQDVISRCALSEDRLLAHVLDWWFVATTGRHTANGGTHQLPDSLDERVRGPMGAVARLAVSMPAARWLDKRRQLDSRLEGLEETLKLERYGAVKIPGERDAWSWLRDQLAPVASALAADRKAETIEIDWKHFEQVLREAGVEAGSRRYREMIKRCREANKRINEIVQLQHEVEPWIRRQAPELISEVPRRVVDAVGPLANSLLRPILSASVAPDVDTSGVVERLDEAARSSDQRGRYRLARIVDSWCEQTGRSIPALEDELRRHRSLTEAMQQFGANPSVSDDDVADLKIHILDDDLQAADAALNALREALQRKERARVARAQFEGLRRKLGDSSLSGDVEWRGRVAGIESRLGSDDPHELAREIGAALTELSRDLDGMLEEQQEDLRQIAAALKDLRAADSVVREWERRIAELERRGGRGASEIKQGIEEALRSQRDQCRADVEQRLGQVDRILTDERDDFADEDIGVFANRHSEIESLLEKGAGIDADLIDASESAGKLLSEVEDHRIFQWQAAQGEGDLIDHLLRYCKGALDFHSQDIRRLYVSLKTRPFVILAGLTGSGKSSLTRMYAQALGANSGNGRFRRIAVRPDWIDQTEVLGFVNPISGRFVPGWLAETVRNCERDRDRLHFVLLDEMNLAPVEQYLAEWLSAIEEARSGGEDVWLPLYSAAQAPENADEWPNRLALPDNLIIIGTVNVDETTRPLSERVIDRANVLLLSVEVSDRHHEPNGQQPAPWHVGLSQWLEVCTVDPSDDHHSFLADIAAILRQANIGVGLRAHVELERFVANAEGILDPVVALDWGIVQRIIPKIRGFKGPLTDSLNELLDEFEKVGAEQSASIVRRWLDDRVSDDEFLDGTDPRLALARI